MTQIRFNENTKSLDDLKLLAKNYPNMFVLLHDICRWSYVLEVKGVG